MAQRNIDFGSFPDDPSADAIRSAFQKVQENFTEVFAGLADQAVSSINKTPGAGITVNSPTGNVIVTANIACVQVETSTLGIGIGTGNNVATYASLTSSSQILTIDLPSNIANVTDITIDGTLTANYVNANIALTSSNNLFVTSNANVGNLNANNATITTNFSAGNLSTAGNLTVSTNANITGTLGVQGNANVGNLGTSGSIGATGNIIGGNLNANLQITATGNITGQNILSNANVIANGNVVAGNVYANAGTIGASLLTGTLTTNAQPNITSVGTLTSLDVTGNILSGNANLGNAVVANYFIGSGANLTNINGANVTGTVANATHASTANTVVDNAQPNITSVGTLTSLSITGNLSSGNANLGNLAVANYVTGTLTTNAQPNITSVGTLTSLSVTGNISAGNVSATDISGTTLGGTLTTANQPNITNVGTLTSLNVSGNITAPNLIANTGAFYGNAAGLTNIPGANITGNITGNISNATHAVTANTVVDASQPNITSLGTLTGLVVGGNITPNANITYDLGNNTNRFKDIYLANSTIYLGAATMQANANALILTNPQGGQLIVTGTNTANGSSIENGNSNIVVNANSNVSVSVGGTNNVLVVTSTGANILGNANVSGNLSAGNVSATRGTFTNISGEGGNISNVQGANVSGFVANATYANTANTVDILDTNGLTTTYYPTFVENRTTGQTVRADVDLTYRTDINTLTAGNITATGTVTGATLSGSLSTASQPNVTSLGTLTGLSVNGNITAANITANTGILTGNGSGLSQLAGANVTGTVANATYAVSAGSANTAGTVTTAAQPNITSLGTLTDLNVSGNASFTGSNIYISNLANFRIPGGVSGYTIKTDGAGNLAWGADTAAAAGSNTDVQFNDAGSIGGTSGLTFNKTSNLLTVGGGLTVNNTSATVNFTNTANVTLGAVGNLHISGGASNTVLTTNGSGGLSFTAFAGTPPGGPNGAVQYNSSTVYTGESAFAYNDSTNTLSVDNISMAGSGSLSGPNSVSANFLTGTLTTNSQPNITTIGTLSNLIVSGNINAGNISGNGYNLSSVNGANVSGAVAYATTANSVAGGNVSGAVAYATTANSVAGANVSGTVANATYATSAGSATTAGTVTTNAQPNITSLGSLSSLIVNGNINAGNIAGGNLVSANFFSGNANALFNIQGANVTGTVASATSAGSATTAGTVTTAAQPNITSVGTLSSLTVSGNVTAANLNATTGVVASTLTSNVSTGTAPITVTSTTRVANLNVSYANVSDFNGVSTVSTGSYYLLMGNVITGNVALTGNSAFVANTANGSITATTFVGALSGAATSATTAGTVTTAAQPNITSVGTLTSLGVNGTVTAVNFTANTGVFTGNGSGLSSIAGANVTGTVASATSATSATTAGTVTTAAQPNITSVGTLTSLTSSGNISGANVIATAYHIRSVGTAISANGSTQGTATVLTKEMNIVTTVSSGQGVILPNGIAGLMLTITNTSANSLLVYPGIAGSINSLSSNIGYTMQASSTLQFITATGTQWYTVGATYA